MFNTYSPATAGKRGITVLDRYLPALLLCVVAAWLGEPLRYRRAWDHPGFTTVSVLGLTAAGLLLIPVVLGLRRLWGRPRFQLSSRSILLASLCVAVACGCFVSDRAHAARRRKAIAGSRDDMVVVDSWLTLASGDWRRPGHPTFFFETLGRQVYFRRPVTPDEMADLLRPFTDLEVVKLQNFSREILDRLTSEHRGLRALSFGESNVTDEDVRLLERCQDLRFIPLDSTRVTDEGLASLAKLRRLWGINLSDTAVTDRGLQTLESCASLQHLDLRGCKITPEAVAKFSQRRPSCSVTYDGYGVNEGVNLIISEIQAAMEYVER